MSFYDVTWLIFETLCPATLSFFKMQCKETLICVYSSFADAKKHRIPNPFSSPLSLLLFFQVFPRIKCRDIILDGWTIPLSHIPNQYQQNYSSFRLKLLVEKFLSQRIKFFYNLETYHYKLQSYAPSTLKIYVGEGGGENLGRGCFNPHIGIWR